ncbi:hypothetical protein BaRGS_00009935 [Batillaria attramentaria]|uniref:Uncharacterized protein n=1 Tax=Batillaria attramentaria TaxID=370345 RepID=A0ABD0LIA4_9CAEN
MTGSKVKRSWAVRVPLSKYQKFRLPKSTNSGENACVDMRVANKITVQITMVEEKTKRGINIYWQRKNYLGSALWRHEPMLPLRCLMDRVTTPKAMQCSTEIIPSEKKSRRRGKKKLLRHRKSETSASWTVLSSPSSTPSNGSSNAVASTTVLSTKFDTGKQLTRLPKLRVNSARFDVLSTPPPRNIGAPAAALAPPSERRKKLPLLAAIKPENEKSECERFMRANFNYNPFFLYRNPADEEMMERFSTPSDQYLPIAIHIMEEAIQHFGSYENFEEHTGGRVLTRVQILSLVRRYLKKEDLESEIQVNLSEDLLSRGSMTQKKGRPQLNVRVFNLRENWCDGLLRHEIGTHYLRSCNNRLQPWGLGRQRRELCLQHFNPTEEGLASLHSVLFRPQPYLWRAALLYYVTHKAAHLSFRDLFLDLGKFVQSPTVRWDYCVRAKRGQSDTSLPGTFCKDQVYLDGALQLLKRRRTLDFHMLVRLGKVAHGDVDRLMEHCQVEGTRIPSFMNDLAQYRQQLNNIAFCNGLTDTMLEDVA